jgi:hypothetical protein
MMWSIVVAKDGFVIPQILIAVPRLERTVVSNEDSFSEYKTRTVQTFSFPNNPLAPFIKGERKSLIKKKRRGIFSYSEI